MTDITDVAAKGKEIFSMIQSGSIDFGTVIADVEAIVADVQKARQDCSMYFAEEETVERELVAETSKCAGLTTCLESKCSLIKPQMSETTSNLLKAK